MGTKNHVFTLGIEEEFQIMDRYSALESFLSAGRQMCGPSVIDDSCALQIRVSISQNRHSGITVPAKHFQHEHGHITRNRASRAERLARRGDFGRRTGKISASGKIGEAILRV
jgi:hypothetical protein